METLQGLQDFLSAVMHAGSQYLLVPTMACLVLLIVVTVFLIGAVIVEFFAERRHFRVSHREVIAQMHDADYGDMEDVIARADLLSSQIEALEHIAGNMGLPDEELFALAQVELERADKRYRRRVNLTDTIAKIAPMLGLMGTLIPLGPGIVALGQGDVTELSGSLLIAFDTTIAGLVCAIVSLVVSRLHRTWYGEYATMMQALASCILEEAARARDEGIELPYGSAGLPENPSRKKDAATEQITGNGAQAAGEALG